MSDGEERLSPKKIPGSSVGEVVSKVTVKALQEFETDDIGGGEKKTSRPSSGRPGSGKPSSARGSRPGTGTAERPPSATGSKSGHSRPTSAAERPKSNASRPSSAAKGSKPASPDPLIVSGSRPGSVQGSPKGSVTDTPPSAISQTGSRPPSSRERPPSVSQRPTSGKERPTSGTERRRSGTQRPASGEERPTSAAQRPTSGTERPTSGTQRPASGAQRPGSGAQRPGSGAQRPGSGAERPGSGTQRPGSGQASSGRPVRPDSGKAESIHVASGGHHSSGEVEQPVADRPPSERHLAASEDTEGQWASGQQDGDEQQEDPPQQTELDSTFQPIPPTTQALMSQGGGDDDGADESDDDEEDMDDVDEEDEDSDDDSDGDEEMVVLDPDHPLMRRFQKALHDHLEKQNEKVTLELRELLEGTKNKRQMREDIGVELYGIQQELARHQMILEKHHDDFSNLNQGRTQTEQELADVRGMYKDCQLNVNDEKKTGAELQQEVENLALRLFYMDNAKEDVRSDIAVMKRAAEKADTEVTKAELEKQKQDLFVDRLVERVDKLREDIAMYEAQLTAQTEESKAAKEALMEAHMEIEGITLEKKQLFQQWNSSLIGMRRRDEAHSAMQEALNQQQQRILSLETEIEGYKKSITKEQEQNEKLTLIFAKTEMDIATVKKLLAVCQAKQDALKNEYATYTRMLHETEQALNRATTDKTLRLNEVNALRKQIEREYLEKVRLEDEILEKMRSQLTLDKASQYTDKLTKKLRDRTKDMDTQMAQVENEISKTTLEVSHTVTRSERLKKSMVGLDEEIAEKNKIISRSDAEIVKRNAVIERKQGIIDQYNKKLELMISQAGGVELGPLEITINSLQKSIEAEQGEITELQQMWLRDQSELVRLSKVKDKQSVDVDNLKKQLTILSQKKLRIEGDIDGQQSETSDIERSIRNMQNDMLKLNMLLHKERGIGHDLQQGNILMEGDFVASLKAAEKDSIEMQAKLDGLSEEKERLLNSLVEAERQIMLWEKKTQLARETRAAVDSEVGQGEIRAMNAEIHRMQVRYSQLMKQQERMIQEMEKAVSRRDTIVTRGDAQTKTNNKVLTKGSFQRQIAETKKKIKQTIQDANGCDQEIRELREHQGELGSQIEERQLNVQQLQSNADSLDGDIDRLLENKQKNLSDLLVKQQRTKYYQQLKDGHYVRLCKTDTALDSEHVKQVERLQTLTAIVDRLTQEFPHAQPSLRKAGFAYGSRALTTGEDY